MEDLKNITVHDYVDSLHHRINQLETILRNVSRNLNLANDWIPEDIIKDEQ